MSAASRKAVTAQLLAHGDRRIAELKEALRAAHSGFMFIVADAVLTLPEARRHAEECARAALAKVKP